jgi:hypothetical protein
MLHHTPAGSFDPALSMLSVTSLAWPVPDLGVAVTTNEGGAVPVVIATA